MALFMMRFYARFLMGFRTRVLVERIRTYQDFGVYLPNELCISCNHMYRVLMETTCVCVLVYCHTFFFIKQLGVVRRILNIVRRALNIVRRAL